MPVLREATDAEKRERDALCFQAWGEGLTLEQFLEREAALRAHGWSAQAMKTWLWVEGAQVLASCETFRMEARVGAQVGHAYGVASVFTEQTLRGKGHAGKMLEALKVRLSTEPGALAQVLFSEVGARLYQQVGYRVAEVGPMDSGAPTRPLPGTPGVTRLREYPEPAWLAPPQAGVLQLRPSALQLDWHLERGRLYARFLGRRLPQSVGARCGDVTLLWAPYFKTNELKVLWATPADGGASAQQAFREAIRQAHKAGLHSVRIWRTDVHAGAQWLQQDFEGRQMDVLDRSDELPMFVPLGKTEITGWSALGRGLWV